jgi:hypothetical protein
MNRKYDRLWIGLIASVLWPFIVMFIYYLIYYRYMSIAKFISFINEQGSWVPRIKLCVYANLIPFYLFLRFNFYYAVRGVILGTLLYAGIVVYLMFSS